MLYTVEDSATQQVRPEAAPRTAHEAVKSAKLGRFDNEQKVLYTVQASATQRGSPSSSGWQVLD